MSPLYEYSCPSCHAQAERLVPIKDMKTPNLPCPDCKTPMFWAGLSAHRVGKEQRFAAIMQDGTRIPGRLNRSAPLKKRS